MAPTGPPAAAPTANPVTTPIFSCLDAGCRTVTVSSACTGNAVTQAAATARAIERLRIWVIVLFIRRHLSWLRAKQFVSAWAQFSSRDSGRRDGNTAG